MIESFLPQQQNLKQTFNHMIVKQKNWSKKHIHWKPILLVKIKFFVHTYLNYTLSIMTQEIVSELYFMQVK
ncbi:hypothetical protein BB987_16765 [Photorhabdus temperata]|nr:hypothetical protein BB987_16765 [Photorhabdus temperata]